VQRQLEEELHLRRRPSIPKLVCAEQLRRPREESKVEDTEYFPSGDHIQMNRSACRGSRTMSRTSAQVLRKSHSTGTVVAHSPPFLFSTFHQFFQYVFFLLCEQTLAAHCYCYPPLMLLHMAVVVVVVMVSSRWWLCAIQNGRPIRSCMHAECSGWIRACAHFSCWVTVRFLCLSNRGDVRISVY
jgi:hypothetical protein